MRALFRQFSTPGGVPSHVSVPTPGSIHEGGELGYVLDARLRRRVRQPRSPRRRAWSATARPRPGRSRARGRASSFLNPARDGAVLPILHLNGYKIAGPDRARSQRRRRRSTQPAARATATTPHFVDGRRSRWPCTRRFAAALDAVLRRDPRDPDGGPRRGGTAPAALAGDRAAHAEGLDRAEGGRRRPDRGHVPRAPGAARRACATEPGAPGACSRSGCGATGPRSSSTTRAGSCPSSPRSRRAAIAGWARTRTPTAAACSCSLDLPDFTELRGRRCPQPGAVPHESTRQLGEMLRDIFTAQRRQANFRLFCPDETNSNRLGAVFEVENRCCVEPVARHRRPRRRPTAA